MLLGLGAAAIVLALGARRAPRNSGAEAVRLADAAGRRSRIGQSRTSSSSRSTNHDPRSGAALRPLAVAARRAVVRDRLPASRPGEGRGRRSHALPSATGSRTYQIGDREMDRGAERRGAGRLGEESGNVVMLADAVDEPGIGAARVGATWAGPRVSASASAPKPRPLVAAAVPGAGRRRGGARAQLPRPR